MCVYAECIQEKNKNQDISNALYHIQRVPVSRFMVAIKRVTNLTLSIALGLIALLAVATLSACGSNSLSGRFTLENNPAVYRSS
jgi:hypothetical protein